jgi:two-component system, OmpR family, alkaline phosphatase synthesis response regulator PhoP
VRSGWIGTVAGAGGVVAAGATAIPSMLPDCAPAGVAGSQGEQGATSAQASRHEVAAIGGSRHRSIGGAPDRRSFPSEVSMPTVLIADDEQHIRLLIAQALEELEDATVEVRTAANGVLALDVIRRNRPELVFLDVTLPETNGFEVSQAIKDDAELRGTTVVMLTARGQAYDRAAGEAAGADRYLTKPFDPDELLEVARAALDAARTAKS